MRPEDMDPSRLAALCRRALEPLHFLLGDWEGQGLDHGEPIRARAHGRLILDGSWLELRELIPGPGEEPVHEDRSLYRYDAALEGLRVLHLVACHQIRANRAERVG